MLTVSSIEATRQQTRLGIQGEKSECSFDNLLSSLLGDRVDYLTNSDGSDTPRSQSPEVNCTTPLHVALTKGCGASILLTLIKKYPDACRVADQLGNIPLHIAAYKSSLECINILLQEYNDGIWVQNNEGALPLHYAAAMNKNSAVVARLLEEDFSGSSTVTNKSSGPEKSSRSIVHTVGHRLPLHLAVYFNPSEEVSMLLLLTNQKAGSVCDERGDYPVHLALSHCHEHARRCRCDECLAIGAHVRPSTRSELFLHSLIASSREALAIHSYDGHLPLHMACLENVSFTTIQLITDIYPAAINTPCRRPLDVNSFERMSQYQAAVGSWPFHFAIRQSNSQAVKLFARYVPSLWGELDHEGRTSLHHLVLSSTSFMKEHLGKIDPAWAKVKCHNGWMPIHFVCFSRNSESAYQNFLLVLAMDPSSIRTGAGEDEAETPLALAARFGHLDIVRHILERHSQEVHGLEVPLMFALRADTVHSSAYFKMLTYLCTSPHTASHLANLGNICLQFLLFCRQFWTRKGVFQKQLAILKYVVDRNPAAIEQVGGWQRKRNAYDQFRRKTLSYLKHFSAEERNEFGRIILEAAPHLSPDSLGKARWIARRNAFVVRLRRADDDVTSHVIARLPESLFRKVVMYL